MVSVTVGATVNGLVDGKRSNGRADRHRRQDPTIDSKDKDREQTELPEEGALYILTGGMIYAVSPLISFECPPATLLAITNASPNTRLPARPMPPKFWKPGTVAPGEFPFPRSSH